MSPFKLTITFLLLTIIGFSLLPELSVDLKPDYAKPSLRISFSLPDTPPRIIEQKVTAPLENILAGIQGLKNIKSVSRYNSGSITLEFEEETDIIFRKSEVATLIRQAYGSLPARMPFPLITQSGGEQKTERRPLLSCSVSADEPNFRIRQTIDELIAPRIAVFRGVNEFSVHGAEPLCMKVLYDREKLSAYELKADEVLQTIRRFGSRENLGYRMTKSGQQLFSNLEYGGKTQEDLLQTVVGESSGRAVRLLDVASVYLEEEKPHYFRRVNGRNTLNFMIMPERGVNKLKLAADLRNEINAIQKQLPESYVLDINLDDSEYLRTELDKIYYRSGLSVLILLLFIFLSQRNIKYLGVLFFGLIVNLALTSLMAWALGVQIHLYSLAGITISFGLIVDNAIVMLDHWHKSRNRKAFLALLAASLTTIAALSMIYFLPEEEKQNLWEFALIIALSLSASLITALFFTPACYDLILGRMRKTGGSKNFRRSKRSLRFFILYEKLIAFTAKRRKLLIAGLILLFGIPVFWLPSKLDGEKWYHRIYNASVGSTVYQETIRPHSDKHLGGLLREFSYNVFERSSYRSQEKTTLSVTGEMPAGTTLAQMDEAVSQIENYLRDYPGIEEFVTVVYPRYTHISITFTEEGEQNAEPYRLKGRLIAKTVDLDGTRWSVYGVGRGFENKGGDQLPQYRVELRGYNFETLEELSEKMAAELLKHKRVKEVNTNERLSYNEKSDLELVLSPDRNYMRLSGISTEELMKSLSLFTPQYYPAAQLNLDGKILPLYWEESRAESFDEKELMQYSLGRFRLKDFAKTEFRETSNAVYKDGRQYIRVIGYQYFGSDKFGQKHLDKVMSIIQPQFPPGYSMKKLDFQWDWGKTKRQYSLLAFLLASIFMICAALFENLRLPLYIILMIPLSFIGVFFVFAVLEVYFDQGGYASFVLLGGLVVNASIFIVNDFLFVVRSGTENRRLLRAVWRKSIPVLLTVFSTIFGLIPFLTGGQSEVFWYALASGAVGGLLFSLFGVFVVLPVLLWKKKGKQNN